MYALEAPTPPGGHLANDSASNLEQMTSNLYNLDSASISGYAHPSAHSPYNNPTAHSLLLPSSATYHHPLELNAAHSASNAAHATPMGDPSGSDAHQRISTSAA